MFPTLDDDAADASNEAIAERVNAAGSAYITHTVLKGRVRLRIGLGNMRTTDEHVGHVWSQVLLASRHVAKDYTVRDDGVDATKVTNVQEWIRGEQHDVGELPPFERAE